MAYNSTLKTRRDANNSSNEAIDVALSAYDLFMSEDALDVNNETLRTALQVLQLLTDDILKMQSSVGILSRYQS